MMLWRCYCRFFSPVLKTLYTRIYIYFFFIHKPETEMNEAPQHDSTHGFLHSRTPLNYIQCNNDNNTCEPYNIKVVLPAVNKSLRCTIQVIIVTYYIYMYTDYGIVFFFTSFLTAKGYVVGGTFNRIIECRTVYTNT